jgi:multiple sugar transport system ATP-binding protein
VAGFIGSPQMSFLQVSAASVSTEGVEVILPGGGRLRVPVNGDGVKAGDALTLGLRPEHLSELGQGEAQIPAKALVVEHLGGETFTHAETADGADLMIKGDGMSQVKAGQQLLIGVSGGRCHLFNAQGQALPHRVHYTDRAAEEVAQSPGSAAVAPLESPPPASRAATE